MDNNRYIDPDKFQTLIEINQQINSQTIKESMLLESVLSSSMQLIQGQAASLLLVNHQDKKLYFEIALGPKGKDVKKFTLELGQGIAGWVAQKNRSLIVNNVSEDKRFAGSIDEDSGYRTRNILAVPMRIKDRCIGVIEILNKKSNLTFDNEDLFWLEIFANQAAMVLVNNRRYNQLYTEYNEFKRQFPQSNSEDKQYFFKSYAIEQLFNSIDKIAQSNGSILISGESGVGKEVMAKSIHDKSPRRQGPFIAINCASIPKDLMESELFGHERGAFTGAVNSKVGKFALADGGTLFLDEIGDISIDLQAKLLRVLQEQVFTPVGSIESRHINIRIISATNKNLNELTTKGLFRDDLYYRLSVFPIKIPPLRDRPEDIEYLTEIFIEKICKNMDIEIKRISDDAVDYLVKYSWPGNIRQLYNVLNRAIILNDNTSEIIPDDLMLEDNNDNDRYSGKTLKEALNLFKKYYITKILGRSKGNISRAAKTLDVQRTYLSRLIKDLDIHK